MTTRSSQVGSMVAVLDDDPDTVASIASVLNRRGFVAVSYTSTEALVADAASARFAAYVLDWLLGDTTALHFIDSLRSSPGGRGIPIFLLSGNLAIGGVPADAALARAIQNYRLEFRAKPYSTMQLARDLTSAIDVALK